MSAHARIELNTKKDVKEIIEKAAAISGMAVSSFIISHCFPKAREIVDQERRIVINEEAANQFLEMLDNPPEPNEKLINLFKWYMQVKIDILSSAYDKQFFNCGVTELNDFIRKFAFQNQNKGYSKTYVATENDNTKIVGYYTVTSAEIDVNSLPNNIKHPGYPVSSSRICRLAVDKKHKGKGLGNILLKDALSKIIRASEIIGIFSVIVDAKDDSAKEFYKRYGFVEFKNEPMMLFFSVKTIEKAFKIAQSWM